MADLEHTRIEIAQAETSLSLAERRIANAQAETKRLRAARAALGDPAATAQLSGASVKLLEEAKLAAARARGAAERVQPSQLSRRSLPFTVRERRGASPGFDVEFTLPFKRSDLWRELHHNKPPQQPLGVLSLTRLHRPGSDGVGVSLGALRETSSRREGEFVPGHLSKCVALRQDPHASFIAWEDIDGTASTMLLDEALSTRVTLSYQYDGAVSNPAGGGKEFESASQDDVARRWYEDMLGRGYTPLHPVAPAELPRGFEVSFTLDYNRSDVYRELTRATRPLGVTDDTAVEVLAAGRAAHEPHSLPTGLPRLQEHTLIPVAHEQHDSRQYEPTARTPNPESMQARATPNHDVHGQARGESITITITITAKRAVGA